MAESKSDKSSVRGEPVRLRVIEAAERLLRQGEAEFSMRDLAAEAGVSFATPFNQFGSKAAIMHAISARRVELMEARLREAAPPGDAVDRVLVAVDTAASVMLEEPLVNRSVMGWIGTANPAAGTALARSEAYWSLALAAGDGLAPAARKQVLLTLPRQLAFGFRGVLSFWTAGELADGDLAACARGMALAILRGVVRGPGYSLVRPAQQGPE